METTFAYEMCERRFSRADNLMQVIGREEDGDEVHGKVMYAPGETYDLAKREFEIDDATQTYFEDKMYTGGIGSSFSAQNMPAIDSSYYATTGADGQHWHWARYDATLSLS